MTIVKVDRHLAWKRVHDYFKLQKNDVYFNIEIKRWRALKTNKELGLFFTAIEHFILSRDEFMTHHVNELEKVMLERGIVEKYGERKKTGLIIIDGYGNEIEQEMAIPLSECNRFEQFNKVFTGLFEEAKEQGVDMKGFFEQWEEYKKQERDKL